MLTTVRHSHASMCAYSRADGRRSQARRALVPSTLLEFAACLARAGTMAEKACTIRTRKFLTNPLLGRKQFVRPYQLFS